MKVRMISASINFYPRSPCGERRQIKQTCRAGISISIHALLAESDRLWTILYSCPGRFLSTLSLRRATGEERANQSEHCISIHALLAESDGIEPVLSKINTNFYPRSPCGERQPATRRDNKNDVFLSTLSLRRATCSHVGAWLYKNISIHALLAESDSRTKTVAAEVGNFYPRSPCGERLVD